MRRKMMMTGLARGLMTISEMARRCDISLNQFNYSMYRGLLPRPTVPHGKRLYFLVDQVPEIKRAVDKMKGLIV